MEVEPALAEEQPTSESNDRMEAASLLNHLRIRGNENLSGEIAEQYEFLINTLSSASRAAPEWVLGNLEGDFLNRCFFVGRRGRQESFRSALLYLVEQLAGDFPAEMEVEVVRIFEDAFARGIEETQRIETEMAGAPLETADSTYWKDRKLPPVSVTRAIWSERNRACQDLYWRILGSFRDVVPEQQFDRLIANLEILHFKTTEEEGIREE